MPFRISSFSLLHARTQPHSKVEVHTASTGTFSFVDNLYCSEGWPRRWSKGSYVEKVLNSGLALREKTETCYEIGPKRGKWKGTGAGTHTPRQREALATRPVVSGVLVPAFNRSAKRSIAGI